MINQKFSGWWVVLAGFSIIFIVIGFGLNTAGVFLRAVSRDLGYGKAAFSLVLSISAIAGFFNSIIAGRLLRKYDPQKVTTVYLLITIVGTFMYSQCTQLHHFYLTCIITGIGTTGCTMLPVTMIVGNWFIKNRATAISAIIAGNGLGGFVFNPLATKIIEGNLLNTQYSYQGAYMISALLMLVICLPMTILFLKSSPQKVGQYPDGIKEEHHLKEKKNSGRELTLKQAFRSRDFYFLAVMVIAIAVVYMGTNQHLYVYLTEVLIFPGVRASLLVGTYMIMTVIGIIAFGRVTDKLGLRKAFFMAIGILFIGLLFVGLGRSFVMVGLALCFFGFGNLLQTVGPPNFAHYCFGKKDYPAIYGVVLAIQSVGIAVGPLLGGIVFDKSGNYNAAYYLCIGLVLLAGICGLGILARKKEVIT